MKARGRRWAVAGVLIAAAAATAGLIGLRGERRPDIVVLLWDTTRADRISALGYGRETTPWLEEVAARGVRWEQCRAPSPWTLPSHASLFTGLLPRHHGALDLQSPLAPGHRTLAERLEEVGYDTVLVTNNPLVGPQAGLGQGFATFHFVPEEGAPQSVHGTLQILALALDRRRKDPDRSSRPLFLFVNIMEPHLPYDPPEEVERAWRPPEAGEREVREAKNFQFPGDLAHNLGIRRLPERQFPILSSLYDGEIRTLDDGCRGIEALLAKEGFLSPEDGGFLLVVTSDHGENIGEHGLVDHKFSVADTLLHVPLVIHSPGRFEGGAAVSTQVRLQDLFPTLLEAAGAPPPAPGEAPHALSLLDAPSEGRLQVGEFQAPTSFIEGTLRFFPTAPEEAYLPFHRGLLTAVGPLEGGRRLKWTRVSELEIPDRPASTRESLHDLVADPWEERDLLAMPEPAPADRDAARRLAAEADAWVAPR